MSTMPDLVDYVEHFRGRVIQDALTEATSHYWKGRAEVLEWARPKPTDWQGQATAEELAARDVGLAAAALACRERAAVSLLGGAHV